MASHSRLGKGLGALFPVLPGEDDDRKAEESAVSETVSGKTRTGKSGHQEKSPSASLRSRSLTGGSASDRQGTRKGAGKARAGRAASERTASGPSQQQQSMEGSTVSGSEGIKRTGGRQAAKGRQAAAGKSAAKTSVKTRQNTDSHPSTASKPVRTGSHSEKKNADSGAGRRTNVSRETSATVRRSSRRSIPAIDTLKHPSDVFFGSTVVDVSRETSKSQARKTAKDNDLAGGSVRASAPDRFANQADDAVSVSTAADVAPKSAAQVGQDENTANTNGRSQVVDSEGAGELKPVSGGYLAELNIDDIRPNPQQPRHVFDEEDLVELSRSIKEVGVLQPIVVRKQPADSQTAGSDDSHYEIVMGERRWRATQLAGLKTVPAIVKTTSNDNMLRDALLENLHRVALNPLEEAAAYQQMIDEFGLTQEGLSQAVSKSRPQITNTLRLLKLPPVVQRQVSAGVLSAGHARALLTLSTEEDMEAVAKKIISEGLSVRSTEELVALKAEQSKTVKKQPRVNVWADSEVQHDLENRFDTKVSIRGTKKHGRIEIVFSSPDDMDRILDLLLKGKKDSESDKPSTDDGWV